eukprot:1685301-Ditylum_brightwellii.AAC.1
MDEKLQEENIISLIHPDKESPLPPLQQISTEDEREMPALMPQAELLRWHYCLGHLSFRKIKIMAALELLLHHLMTVAPPKCTAVSEAGQTILYYGDNAHFQNGIVEKVIFNLQEGAKIQLHYAKVTWSSAIDLCMWPYAL